MFCLYVLLSALAVQWESALSVHVLGFGWARQNAVTACSHQSQPEDGEGCNCSHSQTLAGERESSVTALTRPSQGGGEHYSCPHSPASVSAMTAHPYMAQQGGRRVPHLSLPACASRPCRECDSDIHQLPLNLRTSQLMPPDH